MSDCYSYHLSTYCFSNNTRRPLLLRWAAQEKEARLIKSYNFEAVDSPENAWATYRKLTRPVGIVSRAARSLGEPPLTNPDV